MAETELRIGDNIKKARERVGLTAQSLALLLGVHRNTITNWESGKSEPTTSDISRLAKVTGCGLEFLFNGRESISSESMAKGLHFARHRDQLLDYGLVADTMPNFVNAVIVAYRTNKISIGKAAEMLSMRLVDAKYYIERYVERPI